MSSLLQSQSSSLSQPAAETRIAQILQELEQASSPLEESEKADQAEILRHLIAKAGLYQKAQNEAALLRLEAERRTGQLLQELDLRSSRCRGILDQIGLNKDQSSRYQAIARVPADRFQQEIATIQRNGGEITSRYFFQLGRGKAPEASSYRRDNPDAHDTHLTPENIKAIIPEIFGANPSLDPSAEDPGPGQSFNIAAELHFTKSQDGLSQPWYGKIYCNPPYCKDEQYQSQIAEWVAKGLAELDAGRATELLYLLPAYPGRPWFQQLINAQAIACFIAGRLRFGGNPSQAPFDSVLFYLGDNPLAFRPAESLGVLVAGIQLDQIA